MVQISTLPKTIATLFSSSKKKTGKIYLQSGACLWFILNASLIIIETFC